MPRSADDAREVAAGTEAGRVIGDALNPSTFRLAAGTPVGRGAALTAVDATAINATYDATEEGVLNNVRTRLNEVEARLQALGLIS